MAQYDGLAVIPLKFVCRDYFPHLTPENFKRKALAGEIEIPLVRIDRGSQRAAVGVHLTDLAAWIDECRNAAIREAERLAKKA
jgi:hypothetical protein